MGTGIKTEAYGFEFNSFAECCRYFGFEPSKIRNYMKQNNVNIENALDMYANAVKIHVFDRNFKDLHACCDYYNANYNRVNHYISREGMSIEDALIKERNLREAEEKKAEEKRLKEQEELKRQAIEALPKIKRILHIDKEITADILSKQSKDLKCIYIITNNDNMLSSIGKCVVVIGSKTYLIDINELEKAVADAYIKFLNLKIGKNGLCITQEVTMQMLQFLRDSLKLKSLHSAYMYYINNTEKCHKDYAKYIVSHEENYEVNCATNKNLGHKSSLGSRYSIHSSSRLTPMH